ncbi:A/G-specific adenine glycosylase [Filibacter tadaridae]|uniref:Adenine DNA glycosylase n=1 Tax=Filibacter tadaridae TaxID=2483811 RepID=A0A3P5X5Z9_9BACL|nr:A/G-specific adenine glycosylase [Filibacter tadaridae]VDC22704.1 putative A/G-specific adenine glycosylase YfhQ [Filibacter tadaridae]
MQIVENKDKFREALLSWYLREKRDLPWRNTSNPYYIWVSEIMLQQTRVDTVIPYYERFIARFPTMESLVEADESDLLKMWEGLGYYSRVRNLQSGVKEVVENYGSEVPASRKEISELKGIGPYTAGAILSIAFGLPEHAVDGNVMRVISRLLLIDDDIAIPRTKRIFENVIMDLIDQEDPSSFNQGLMELGATICTPKPKCLLCPVREFCLAFNEGRQEEFPVKTKKVKMKVVPVASFAMRNEKNEWLLRKRSEKGLLANLWEFPMIELASLQTPKELARVECDIELTELLSFKHVFSHLTWDLTCYTGLIQGDHKIPDGYHFFSNKEVEELPKPVPVLKIWDEVKQQLTGNDGK